MTTMNEERFINIESKILHQERLLEELHQVLYEQQTTIDKLEKKIKELKEIKTEDSEIRPANEKPPHY
ncbi:MAG: SlyX family protein [Bdellovibrionota bacterium]